MDKSMHKSVNINDSFDNLSFGVDEQLLKKSKDIISKHAVPSRNNNISFDDSMFNVLRNHDLTKEYEVTACCEKKTTLRFDSSLEKSQIKLYTQSNPAILKLSSWGLSATVLEEYSARKITTMFPWQCECLLSDSQILYKQKNLIYSAPTSAGKTLVAEILAIKTVLERRKKVIFILPFISVVREKMLYFQDILGTSGVRVEGFMGSYNPPGGFQNIHIAICTMEKANGLINRLLEEGNLNSIGAVIVDELHMLGDSSRGYLLELLLAKLLYMIKKNQDICIQIIGMSATLPNLDVVANWLDACLYTTQYRPIPLVEQCQMNGSLYDREMNFLRKLEPLDGIDTDVDNILQLCLEPIKDSCSVLIFCPSKQWCENLALQIAEAFYKLGKTATTDLGKMLRSQLSEVMIIDLLQKLTSCPVGLDVALKKTVSFGVAYHHAGLTMDERDIIETAFRSGGLRVLVATSTLSSGVNLPAKRVIIRTPRSMRNMLDVLVYRQMIGRAGRMGKDTSGDSVLVCKAGDEAIGRILMGAEITSVNSCLEGAGKLKRAILEVISSGVATSDQDIDLFTKCTLMSKMKSDESNPDSENEDSVSNPISEAMDFLIRNEFVRTQINENDETIFVPTSLARACLSASMAPDEGLALFSELERARRCIVLETDLHLVYLVTPYSACASWPHIDWMQYMDIWERLIPSMRRVGDLVGVRSSFLLRSIQIGMTKDNLNRELLIHKRFFVSLALQELINEIPLGDVSAKYSCNRGLLQSLQQSAATFAGMVTAFSRQLGWASVELLIGQFQDRLQFGVARELLDLMRLPLLNGQRARVLHTAGIEGLVDLANTSVNTLENILYKATPFTSGRFVEGTGNKHLNDAKCLWINCKNQGISESEAAVLLVNDARKFLQLEMGLDEAKWSSNDNECDDKNIVKLTSTNNTNDKSLLTENLKAINVPRRINNAIKNVSIIDKIFPGIKSEVDESSASKSNINSAEEMIKYQLDESMNLTTNIGKDCGLEKNESRKKSIIEAGEISLDNKLLLNEIDLDLSNRLSNFTFLSQKHNNNKESHMVSERQTDELNSPNLFDDSKEADSIFGKISFTELLNGAKVKEDPNENKLNGSNTSDISLNLHLSLDSKNSNLDISKEILFDDSFDYHLADVNITKSNRNDKPVVLTNSDSGLFENDSAIEQAFANSFNQEENKSVQEKCIHENGQNISDTIIEDSPKNMTTVYEISSTMKRARLKSNCAFGGEDTILSSPKKKTKFNESYRKERMVDFSDVQIIDASKTELEFNKFCEKVLQQKVISISLACIPFTSQKHSVGPIAINSKLNQNSNFVTKSRKLLGISFYWKNLSNVYFLSFHEHFCDSERKIFSLLQSIFETGEYLINMFDAKKQIKIFRTCCAIRLECCVNDPGIADWLIEPENTENNLQEMCLRYCPEIRPLFEDVENSHGSLGCNIHMSAEPRLRASIEAIATWHLMSKLMETMHNKYANILNHYKIEMDCIKLLAEMELVGIGISMYKLKSLADTLKKHLRDIETRAFSLAGRRFNFNSPVEVSKILGLCKNGCRKRVSTSKQVLEHTDRPIAKLVLHWRKLNSTLTRLMQPLLRLVDGKYERIHGTCVTRTATGRISMHEPNIQNVPREFQLDYMQNMEIINCRAVFSCREAHVLISADYCQLELRVLAHLSGDSVLCEIMRQEDRDVFKQIAAKWNGIDEIHVTDPLRQNAKKICYGIIYGMGKKAISDQLTITEEEAIALLESFHKKYTCIKEYISRTVKNCRQNGFIETISGRRRFLPNINHHHSATKSQAERQAVNTTIQGSAADIVKKSMVVIDKIFNETFKTSKYKPQLVLQIHDELLYEIPEMSIPLAASIIKCSMETSVELSVPFPVKLKTGASWGEMTEYLV